VIYDVYDPARIPAAALPVPHGARPGRITPKPRLPELLVEMIAGGEGVTVLPSWEANHYADGHDVVAVRMGAKPLTRSWYCATRQGGIRVRRSVVPPTGRFSSCG
jgi:LysR family transcriptional regulator for metE and metH